MSASATTNLDPFEGPDWTPELRREFSLNARNGHVGQRLVSETERVRVWHIQLKPGERLPFHRHINDYFWTALAAGTARSRGADGSASLVTYDAGETRHYRYGAGESRYHDLENVGDTDLIFVTVEFLGGANQALSLSSE